MTTTALFMNVHTGSVDSADGWDEFDARRDDGTLVEVRATTAKESEDHGKWIAV
jgi:hypothetical protein